MPHDRANVPYLDVLGRVIMIALSQRILVHGERAAGVLTDRFPSLHWHKRFEVKRVELLFVGRTKSVTY